ncbi:PREDICTED: sodium channel modifier 1 [Nanorana parkeri]|uniref:sodium channel modifier 1 n=1 Tax=Nanorana parkeri TaxID=125878 RepID=UPI0008550B8A|nr:PREDICTED: sodium channel modifier 1 [Nanorana parkeri]
MSFKREGDDGSHECNQRVPPSPVSMQKRRVADLLASYIPEDEALLIKNGSYACTVCHHRPVFTTVDMLSIHRKGKKHTACLQRYYGKKAEFRNEVQKRQHREYVRAEEAGEQLPKGPAPLLVQTRRITHNALLKSAPYNSCCSSRNRPGDAGKGIASPELGAPPPSLMSHTAQAVSEWAGTPETEPAHAEPGGSSKGLSMEPKAKKSARHKKKDRKCPGNGEEEAAPGDDPEKKRALEHYLRLRSAGWIPDGSGKWVRDENVEFDTDEEEPPPMPPP